MGTKTGKNPTHELYIEFQTAHSLHFKAPETDINEIQEQIEMCNTVNGIVTLCHNEEEYVININNICFCLVKKLKPNVPDIR